MTEQEWLTSEDPQRMLAWLCTPGDVGLQGGYGRKGSEFNRKLRLFACGCCRQVWNRLLDERSQTAVVLGEQIADGLQASYETDMAQVLAERACLESKGSFETELAMKCLGGIRWRPIARVGVPFYAVVPSPQGYKDGLFDEEWLHRNGGAVVKLAQAIYDERAFERLPILADALEEAGCPREVECPWCKASGYAAKDIGHLECNGTGRVPHPLLAHCRGPGPHARGCHVVDTILGLS